jgi:hypothetical protein
MLSEIHLRHLPLIYCQYIEHVKNLLIKLFYIASVLSANLSNRNSPLALKGDGEEQHLIIITLCTESDLL